MSDELAPIIKKVKKVSGHGHHGGAWKVAYADFVTAMMAFFLLMWLLNATSEEQKRGISNYFGPPGDLSGTGGSGGVLAGLTIASKGILEDQSTSGDGSSDGQNQGKKGTTDTTVEADKDNTKEQKEDVDATPAGPADSLTNDIKIKENAPHESVNSIKDGAHQLDKLDRQNFTEVREFLKQAILQDPELKELAAHLIIDETKEGLRIQLIDRYKQPMFKLGEAQPLPGTDKLLGIIAHATQKLSNKISVTGYTDAVPYANKGYSNWELSADRANAARRVLLREGVNPKRFISITGRSDTDPLIPDNPKDPRNRRISIVLHRAVPSS